MKEPVRNREATALFCCAKCGARAGEPCRSRSGYHATRPHRARLRELERSTALQMRRPEPRHYWTTREGQTLCIETDMQPSHARNCAAMLLRNPGGYALSQANELYRFSTAFPMGDMAELDCDAAIDELSDISCAPRAEQLAWLRDDPTYRALVARAGDLMRPAGLRIEEPAF